MKKILLSLFILTVCFYTFAQQEVAPKPVAPYSQSVMTGTGLLFVSGQIPMNPETGKLVGGDIKDATKQAMKNIGVILKRNDMDFSNVVKCTVFLTDIRDYGAMNEVYRTFFKDGFPAREAIEVSNLPVGARIEISAIAAKDVKSRFTGKE
jgi:2-iminobutanoate/2-iminopropanoate deaminase